MVARRRGIRPVGQTQRPHQPARGRLATGDERSGHRGLPRGRCEGHPCRDPLLLGLALQRGSDRSPPSGGLCRDTARVGRAGRGCLRLLSGLGPARHPQSGPSSAPLPVDALPTALAGVLPEAQSQECINCYVHRMLGRFTCAGDFRIALHYRDTRAPGAKALENRLRNAGATCDCEIISAAWKRERPRRYEPEHPAGIWRVVDRAGPLTLPWPGCKQGGSRSSQPCVLWRRRKRISV